MKVILSNDDGVFSEGLKSLAVSLKFNNELLIVVPDGNRSAVSHSLSVAKNISIREMDFKFGCKTVVTNGTPADCVKIAKLLYPNFDADIVVSGINKGNNIGTDALYSGTVAVAAEAAFFGGVSFAFSAPSSRVEDYDFYASQAVKIIDKLLPVSSKGDFWNINFPDLRTKDIKGLKITSLGKRVYTDRYEKVGENEYRLVGEIIDDEENEPSADVLWDKKGYITATPLLLYNTNYKKLEELSEKCITL